MYVFPKVKRLSAICFFLYLALVFVCALLSPWFVTLFAAAAGLAIVLAVYLKAMAREHNRILSVLVCDQNPKAFLYTIAPILKEATTTQNGLFTWRSLEASALSLLGKEEEALNLRRYLLTLSVPKHEIPLQSLMKGELALELWEKEQKEEAEELRKQMETELSAQTQRPEVELCLREQRALWHYFTTGDLSLYKEHCRLVFAASDSTPLQITEAHFILGRLLLQTEDKQSAREHLQQVTERAPQLAMAQKAKELMENALSS